MIKLNAKKIVRIAICPSCKNKVRIAGNPGEKIYVTCPQCSAKGFISFLKTESKRKAQTKEENKKDNLANNIAVKRVLAGGFISILAVFFLVYMFIPLILGSSHFLIVLSGSMEPTINVGDIVVANRCEPQDIHVGNIIAFSYTSNSNNCITHRVTEIVETSDNLYFMTKGDANDISDVKLVSSQELIGKTTLIIPYLGYIPYFAKTLLGLLTIVIIPGCLIIVNELHNIWQIKKRQLRRKI